MCLHNFLLAQKETNPSISSYDAALNTVDADDAVASSHLQTITKMGSNNATNAKGCSP